jgi:hypothetical protein
MSDEKVYEMLWDCKYCGTQKLLGKTHRFCPNCGAAQDDEARYFPSDDEKVAVEDHVFVGADVICPACDTLNSADSAFCQQCGSSLSEAATAQKVVDDQVIRDGEQFVSTGARDIAQERFEQKLDAAGIKPPASKGGNNLVKYGIIGVIGLVAVALLATVFWKQEATGYVTGHTWTREIQIEQMAARAESAWCDTMPGDAYSVTRRTEQRGSVQVPDGEECTTRRVDNGDGTFSERRECRTKYRSEPVYDDRCYYTVNRWGYERSANASGDSVNAAPYWPDVNLARTGSCLGCEREGGRNASYLVHLRVNDQEFICALEQDQWAGIPIESIWNIQIGVITNQPDCSSLERAS